MARLLHTADWQIGRHSLLTTSLPGRARGGRFAEDDAALLAEARAAGRVTDALRAARADTAVALARRYELGAVVIIVALMVLKPF